MIESEDSISLRTDYGHLDTWLGFFAGLLYFLYLYGDLGSQRFLERVYLALRAE